MNRENLLNKNIKNMSNNSFFLVSVLMPLYRPKIEQLKAAIDSLENQTFQDFQLVIVDDTPDNQEIESLLSSYKTLNINYHHNNIELGLSKSLNYGISLCNSDYVARADCDDIYHETRLQVQLNFLSRNKNIDVCGSNCKKINNQGEVIGIRLFPETDKNIKSKMHVSNPIAHPSVMARKSFFDDLNGYSEDVHVEDYELWLRAKQHNKNFYNIQSNLCYLRVINSSPSRRGRSWDENLQLKLKYFDSKNLLSSLTGVIIFSLIVLLPESVSTYFDKIRNRVA
tara:strand:- start:961 stop:1809 length:849 start_codon:yes stop_codon:yes gene_type:complete